MISPESRNLQLILSLIVLNNPRLVVKVMALYVRRYLERVWANKLCNLPHLSGNIIILKLWTTRQATLWVMLRKPSRVKQIMMRKIEFISLT